MIKRVGQFLKVSEGKFGEALGKYTTISADNKDVIASHYSYIKIPVRATIGSAGYDFCAPVDIKLNPGDTMVVPTGIRCIIEPGWVLSIYPRSSMGFKYRLQLDNTVGIIDSDYFYSDNEGQIMIKITNDSKTGKVVEIPQGAAFAQGVFTPYGITFTDDAKEVRNGGTGSTTKSV